MIEIKISTFIVGITLLVIAYKIADIFFCYLLPKAERKENIKEDLILILMCIFALLCIGLIYYFNNCI